MVLPVSARAVTANRPTSHDVGTDLHPSSASLLPIWLLFCICSESQCGCIDSRVFKHFSFNFCFQGIVNST